MHLAIMQAIQAIKKSSIEVKINMKREKLYKRVFTRDSSLAILAFRREIKSRGPRFRI